jgi:hypothetical protein
LPFDTGIEQPPKLVEPVPVKTRFPSEYVPTALTSSKGFNVAKLLVGVSVVWSMLVKLLTVNVFALPELSVPKAPLSWNSKKNPFVPYVPE